MATEILNVDELRKAVEATWYDPDHHHLLAALRSRYPDAEFNLTATGETWTRDTDAAVDEGGTRKNNIRQWLSEQFVLHHDNVSEIFDKYAEMGLRYVEVEGSTVIITAPYSMEPDGFFQIEVNACHEKGEKLLFDRRSRPESLEDFFSSSAVADTPWQLSGWKYQFHRMTNIRRFAHEMVEVERQQRLAELPEVKKKTIRMLNIDSDEPPMEEIPFLQMQPDWLSRPRNEMRLLQDWRESSAGEYRFCDHWYLSLRDYECSGRRHMGWIPCPASEHTCDALQIHPAHSPSISEVMEALEAFDGEIGYPMAWYFYMLHGYPIGYHVGAMVAEALAEGEVWLSGRDEKVLLRWFQRHYGF